MKIDELKAKHEYHEQFQGDWELYGMVRRSGDELVQYALRRQPRETIKNWNARVRDGVVFNFGKTVVEIFNFYLNQKETTINIKGLEEDKQWKMFGTDSDLQGTDYKDLMIEARKWASYYGAIGILVNKPQSPGRSVQDEINSRVYPYCSLYSLPNIYDWKWARNPLTHRKELVYLKLYEGDDTWTIWKPDSWQRYELDKRNLPKLVGKGPNPLGEIPFIWMLNMRDLEYPEIGMSDVVDIAPIVCSVAQNLSCADEIIKYAGFPIMRSPMKKQDLVMATESESPNATDDDDDNDGIEVGATAVSEFDPSLGAHGKADWMPTEILEPIEAILKVIDRKGEEAYRIAYLSGVNGQRVSGNGEASGLKLRYELSQLNSVLISKSNNSIEAQRSVIDFWLKWQKRQDLFDGAEIKQSHEFSIDDLAVALENAIEAYGSVLSKTFRERLQRKVAFSVMPDLSQDDKGKIVTEIQKNTPEKCEFMSQVTNRALVKPPPAAGPDHSRDQLPKPEKRTEDN